ncbi:MAG: ABC transporter permease [Deltaproteobacteria bacterium]|nr:MAG: ABC transporter permease [Deltaproteobacteria bacterium]
MATSSDKAYREYASYWAIVWEQFRKQRSSYWAMWLIFGLFALAIYAPVFSSSQPFVWRGSDGGLSFPWFSSLLFNRNVFENGVDLFFNLLLVLSPALLVSFLLIRTRARSMKVSDAARLHRQHLLFWNLIILAAFIGLMLTEPRTALPEYREFAAAGLESGFALFPPLRIHYEDTLHGVTGPGIVHVLGQDNAGRDIFVRLLYGTRVSLSIGVIAVSIYITIGIVLGSIAGYFGGRTDIVVVRLIEIFLCFPAFFLILTFIGFLDQPSIAWVMVIIGLIGWTGPARLVRGEFLRLRNIDFVAAARALGLSNTRIIFRHILPNAMGPVLVNATFGVASAVLIESTLSFLGFGDPTLPSWGRILAFGRSTSDTQMMLIAGFAIFVTVSAFNMAGEGIRDALDPKLRK